MQALKILLRCWLIAFVSIFFMDMDNVRAGEEAEQTEDAAQTEDTVQTEDAAQTEDVQSSPPPKASPKAAKKASQKTKKKKTPKKASKKAKTNKKLKPEENVKTQPAPPPARTSVSTQKKKDSPILGEDDSGMDDEDDEIESDEDDVSPSKKDASQRSDQKKLSKSEIDKENKKNKKRDEKRTKLLEGFRQAEEFHKTWFNLPPAKIKASHEKLTKFCKVACTKKHCMDDQVANQCHLMCPASTTKQCPDPLKQGDMNTDEVTIGGEETSADIPTDDPDEKKAFSSSVASSIEEADKALRESEGEGG